MKDEIKEFFKGEVMDDSETLSKYSRDASLLAVRPQVVVFPEDKEDVKNLVRWVSENSNRPDLLHTYGHIAITARCAGTDMSGGAIGESIIMDFSRHMNRLLGGPVPLHDPEGKITSYGAGKNNWEITVEPGMFYRDFEKITLSKGLILPCYTASKSLNAMGGMYGNNSAGERTLKYGKTEDYVLGAKLILADGNEYEVKPLSRAELEDKMKQENLEGEIYQKIFNLVKDNEDEIVHAKPKVSKNSAGYYIWNLIKNQNTKNLAALPSLRGLRHGQDFLYSDFFDLNKLLVGSQGTLGIVTEITFRLIPEKKYSKLAVIFMQDLAPLGRLVDEILELKPETLESYDDKTMKLAVRFFFDFLKNKGFVGMFKFMWSFLPELKMMLTGGFPKLAVLVEFAGVNEEAAHQRCLELRDHIKHFGLQIHITESEAESGKYWDIRRESFALLRKHVRGKHTAPFIDDIVVRPEFLPKFLPELNKILGEYDITYTVAGHAGDGNFHIIPLMDFKRQDTAKIIMELGEKVYDLVARYHGSITAEHNDGLIRTPYLGKMFSPRMLEIFAEIKQIFDPYNIFNPGKKVATETMGGTKKYLKAHIIKD